MEEVCIKEEPALYIDENNSNRETKESDLPIKNEEAQIKMTPVLKGYYIKNHNFYEWYGLVKRQLFIVGYVSAGL